MGARCRADRGLSECPPRVIGGLECGLALITGKLGGGTTAPLAQTNAEIDCAVLCQQSK
jgi:hypothetical protein